MPNKRIQIMDDGKKIYIRERRYLEYLICVAVEMDGGPLQCLAMVSKLALREFL